MLEECENKGEKVAYILKRILTDCDKAHYSAAIHRTYLRFRINDLN